MATQTILPNSPECQYERWLYGEGWHAWHDYAEWRRRMAPVREEEEYCWDTCGACGGRRDAHIEGVGRLVCGWLCPEFRPTDAQGEWRWMPWLLEALLAQHHCAHCPHCGHYIGWGDIAWNDGESEDGTPQSDIYIVCEGCQRALAHIQAIAYPLRSLGDVIALLQTHAWRMPYGSIGRT